MVLLSVVVLGIYSTVTFDTISYLSPNVVFNNTLPGLREDFPSFGIAMFNALYCFDGYVTVAFLVEEVKKPTRTIPLVTFTAMPFVMLVYIVINLAASATLSRSEMASSDLFIYDMAHKVGGNSFAYIVPLLVAVCIIPGIAAVFYNLPRLIMSSAREGQFPGLFSLIHKKRRTPVAAILFLAVFSTVLTLTGLSLETMLQICNVSIWFEYAFAVSTILVNRWKRPNLERTYRTWITTPIVMILIPIALVVLIMFEEPLTTSLIIVVMAMGLPIYYLFLHKKWANSISFQPLTNWMMQRFPLVACESEDNK